MKQVKNVEPNTEIAPKNAFKFFFRRFHRTVLAISFSKAISSEDSQQNLRYYWKFCCNSGAIYSLNNAEWYSRIILLYRLLALAVALLKVKLEISFWDDYEITILGIRKFSCKIWITFNLLTTNVPIIFTNQLTGFYMRGTLVVKGLSNKGKGNRLDSTIFNLEIWFAVSEHWTFVQLNNAYLLV